MEFATSAHLTDRLVRSWSPNFSLDSLITEIYSYKRKERISLRVDESREHI